MQITFDTATATAPELRMLQELIGELYRRATSTLAAGEQTVDVTTIGRLAPVDMPDAGQVIPPAPPVISAPPAPGAIELDSRGLPWDGRIHSSTKKKTDAGQWVWRKGMAKNQTIINAVEAELRALLPQQQPQTATPGPVFPQAPAVAPTVTLPPIPVVAPTTPTAPLPTLAPVPALPPVPPVPVAITTPTTFAELTQALQPQMVAGKITPDVMNMACMQAGVPGMMGLPAATPEQIATVFKALSA